jgi:C4-dicarboxylate-specific signal transduction histidine kinase
MLAADPPDVDGACETARRTIRDADDLPLVTANRVQLQQVILNLLRNASEAMALFPFPAIHNARRTRHSS